MESRRVHSSVTGGICFVYILRSREGIYYCGITNDLSRRAAEHNNGRSGFTRKFSEWIIVYAEELGSRKMARMMEVKIKNVGVRRWVEKYALARSPDGSRARDTRSV